MATTIAKVSHLICSCYPQSKDGHEWNQIIGQIFGDCVYTAFDMASFALGMLTLILNISSLLPQIVLNYRNKKTEGLSVALLLIWIIADITSFSGAVLLDQLVTQKIIAIYFLIVDCIILFQCYYYGTGDHDSTLNITGADKTGEHYISDIPLEQYVVRLRDDETASLLNTSYQAGLTCEFAPVKPSDEDFNKLLQDDIDDLSPIFPAKSTNSRSSSKSPTSRAASSSTIVPAIAVVSMTALCCMMALSTSDHNPMSHMVSETVENAVKQLPSCAYTPNLSQNMISMGILISWISGFLFCAARIPQIISNIQLSKLNIPLDGLSPSVFIITALGNFSYAASVFLRVQIDSEFWYKTFPFIVGSLGTILFDIIILIQIHVYNKRYEKNFSRTSRAFEDDEDF